MAATFINAFYEAFEHALMKPGVVPHPSWYTLPLFNQPVLTFGE